MIDKEDAAKVLFLSHLCYRKSTILLDYEQGIDTGRVRNPATDAIKEVRCFLAEPPFSRHADFLVKITADGIYEAYRKPDCV